MKYYQPQTMHCYFLGGNLSKLPLCLMPSKMGFPPRHKEPGWRYWSARHARSPAPENHVVTFSKRPRN